MISYINIVKSSVSVPVTTADSWDYWLDLEKSQKLIEAVDFVAVHIYPIWRGLDIDQGMNSTIDTYNKLQTAIPSKKIIISGIYLFLGYHNDISYIIYKIAV